HTSDCSSASATAYGRRLHAPTCWATAPASHGSAAPPTTDPALMSPIAVGTSRASVTSGTTAIVGGKIGPRQEPRTVRPTTATGAGDSHTSAAVTATATRHPVLVPTVDSPARVATGLMRNRPRVSPSQKPLTAYPAARSA